MKLNDVVQWTTTAGGVVSKKIGKIVEVVPAGVRPEPRTGLYEARIGRARGTDSYVVAIGNKHYWPITSGLSLLQGDVGVSLTKKKKKKSKKAKIVNYIGIALDMSGSMSHLKKTAVDDVNELLNTIRTESEASGQKTIVSIVHFGVPGNPGLGLHEYNPTVTKVVDGVSIKEVENYSISNYTTNGLTPLYDSVMLLADDFEKINAKNNSRKKPRNVSFLITAITDGYENDSRTPERKLKDRINNLQATDLFTFTFRVPEGHKRSFVNNTNVVSDNVMEWKTTSEGLSNSSSIQSNSMSGFYTARAKGATSTKTFYTNLNASSSTIKRKLTDLTPLVRILPVVNDTVIKDFVEYHGSSFQTGYGYYQLVKTSRPVIVQPYKEILVKSKIDGKIYGGEDSRDLLGVPYNEEIKLKPGDTGDYEVYVQSTSVNRKLLAGTSFIYRAK